MPQQYGDRLRHARLGRVLVVYGSASFGVLQGADILTARLPLPDWLFTGTLLIVALALPVVVATALVHGGDRARRAAARPNAPADAARADSDAPAAAPDAAGVAPQPSQPAAATKTDRSGARPRDVTLGFLTWKRSTALIALAFGLLIFATSGFVAMRSLGIGPAATLFSRGVLDVRDPLIIAEFESAAADSALARVVTDAFRIDLSQSPSIAVLQPQQLVSTLQLMGRQGDERVSAALAQELAQRRGVKAIVTGELQSAGSGWLLSARMITADSGVVLIAHRETAASAEALIPAIDRLSKRLRERIGESLRTVRAEPLAQVTTSSLEALRYYTQGSHAYDMESDHERALALLDDAVRADSTFAMAHRKIGIITINRNLGFERAIDAFQRAYRHRDRLTARERHITEAAYFTYAEPDLERSMAAYRAALALDPDNDLVLNNLAIQLMATEQFPEAERMLRRALEVDSTGTSRYLNLASLQFQLGRNADASVTLDAMRHRFGATPAYEQHLALMAAAEGDYDRTLQHLDALAAAGRSSQAWRTAAATLRMSLLVLQGRLADAEPVALAMLRDMPGVTPRSIPLQLAMGRAQLHGIIVGTPEARADALAALDEAVRRMPVEELPLFEQPLIPLALLYAQLGRPDVARSYVERFDRDAPPQLRAAFTAGRQLIEAEIAQAEGRTQDALGALATIGSAGACRVCVDAVRARIWEAAGRSDSAIAVSERLIATRELGRLQSDATELPRTLMRLARLYDEAGDAARARHYYARFINLWQDADPVLQPRVDAARRRLSELMQG